MEIFQVIFDRLANSMIERNSHNMHVTYLFSQSRPMVHAYVHGMTMNCLSVLLILLFVLNGKTQ